jgi:hypothetical protein
MRMVMPSERPIDVESQARNRYAELVEKKYASSLSQAEQTEMLRLQAYFDEIEAEFYEPAKKMLSSALAKLRAQAKR